MALRSPHMLIIHDVLDHDVSLEEVAQTLLLVFYWVAVASISTSSSGRNSWAISNRVTAGRHPA